MSSYYRIILSSNPCDDILSSWWKKLQGQGHICFQKSFHLVFACAPTSDSNYIEPEKTHRESWLEKRRSCSEILISRSAKKVWVKIEAALQGSTTEQRVQTILWALGLLHNETLCAFEAHFSWEPAKHSSRGVTLKDFQHNRLTAFLVKIDLLELWVYCNMIFFCYMNTTHQVFCRLPHVKECL